MLPSNQSLDPQPQRMADTRLEAALAGEYSLSIKNIFDEAWEKTLGFKTVYWEAMGIGILIAIGMVLLGTLFYVAISMVLGHVPASWDQFYKILESTEKDPRLIQVIMIIFEYIGLFIILPILAGFLMLAIRRVSNLPIRVGTIFDYYHKPWRYLLADIWISFFFQNMPAFLTGSVALYLAGYMGIVAYWLCIPVAITIGIYAYISYFFAIPLLADRKLTTWRALETSRKVVGCHWFEVCRTVLVILLVTILIPAIVIALLASNIHPILWVLVIIFVWLFPFSALSMGILYRDVMGVYSK